MKKVILKYINSTTLMWMKYHSSLIFKKKIISLFYEKSNVLKVSL